MDLKSNARILEDEEALQLLSKSKVDPYFESIANNEIIIYFVQALEEL